MACWYHQMWELNRSLACFQATPVSVAQYRWNRGRSSTLTICCIPRDTVKNTLSRYVDIFSVILCMFPTTDCSLNTFGFCGVLGVEIPSQFFHTKHSNLRINLHVFFASWFKVCVSAGILL